MWHTEKDLPAYSIDAHPKKQDFRILQKDVGLPPATLTSSTNKR